MLGNLVIRSRADSPGLMKAAIAIEQADFERLLGYLNYTRAHYEHYPELLEISSVISSAWSTRRRTTRLP